MPLSRAVLLLVFSTLFAGCGLFKQLEVDPLATSAEKPSNVAAYISVSDGNEPVTELTEQNFKIFENEQPIDPSETKQTLLDRDLVALHKTLLLVDVSAVKDDGTRQQLSRSVAGFVARARKAQGVTVYTFDGGAEPKLIGDYPKGESGPSDIPELASLKSSDPSRNLHGAVIAAVKELGARLMGQQKPVRVGTLVVLTAGPDLAGRATAEQMQQALESSGYLSLAIGIGAPNAFDINAIGKNGKEWVPSLGETGPVLEDTASRVESLMQRYYLLSYCSPARAGKRSLRVEVSYTNTEGNERKGDFTTEFDASGFGPGCDPSQRPHFGATGDVETEDADSKKDDGKKGDTKSETKKGDTKSEAKKGDAKKNEGDAKKGEGEGKKGEGEEGIVPPPNKPGYAPVPNK